MLNSIPFVYLKDIFEFIVHYTLNIIADNVTQLLAIACILDKAKRGMKCDCQEDYEGIFCENYIQKPTFKFQTLQNTVPAICDKANYKKSIKKKITVTTLQKKNSFFIIQGFVFYF